MVIDITGDHKVIAEVSFPTALTTLHEKAIYLHEARQYQVERFDYDGRKAYVRRVDCDYFTDAIDYTQVKILENFERADLNGAEVLPWRCSREPADRRLQEDQVLHHGERRRGPSFDAGAGDAHDLFLAAFPGSCFFRNSRISSRPRSRAASPRSGNALRSVAALLLMCDPRDLGVAVTEDVAPGKASSSRTCIFTTAIRAASGKAHRYSSWPRRLFRHTYELISTCACELGCPSCTGPIGEVGERGKEAAANFSRRSAIPAGRPAKRGSES